MELKNSVIVSLNQKAKNLVISKNVAAWVMRLATFVLYKNTYAHRYMKNALKFALIEE